MCFCVENFKTIPHYSKYKITTKGRIWSNYKNDWLKHSFDKKGYMRVSVVNDDNIRKTVRNHILVMETYGNRDINLVIDHIDRNKQNNCICNLRNTTISENNRNRNKKGTIRPHRRKFRFSYKIGKVYHQKYFDTERDARIQQLVYISLRKVFKIIL
jgi:hypothetical protein